MEYSVILLYEAKEHKIARNVLFDLLELHVKRRKDLSIIAPGLS